MFLLSAKQRAALEAVRFRVILIQKSRPKSKAPKVSISSTGKARLASRNAEPLVSSKNRNFLIRTTLFDPDDDSFTYGSGQA